MPYPKISEMEQVGVQGRLFEMFMDSREFYVFCNDVRKANA
jgi:hypothetical protein